MSPKCTNVKLGTATLNTGDVLTGRGLAREVTTPLVTD